MGHLPLSGGKLRLHKHETSNIHIERHWRCYFALRRIARSPAGFACGSDDGQSCTDLVLPRVLLGNRLCNVRRELGSLYPLPGAASHSLGYGSRI